MKIAIVTDSNSGMTQKEAAQLGIYLVPMPFVINGESYLEDINLTQEEFYTKLENDADVSTSQPSLESVLELWDEILKTHDQLVHIPMSSGLSGSCQTAMMLASDDKYEGKVFVIDNQRVSATLYQSVMDAKLLISQGADGAHVKKRLEETKFDSVIFITVDTLKYLKKGGRITPAVAMLGTLLKIKPVLSIFGERLDSYAKARTMKQAKSMMMEAVQKELEERLQDPECRHTHLAVVHSQNEEAAEAFKKEVQERYPFADIRVTCLSLSVACHIGPGSLALTATRKLVEEDENTPK